MVTAVKDAPTTTVVLRPKRGITAPFKRTVYQRNGDIDEILIFPQGVPVELNPTQLKAVKSDIAKGVLIAYEPGERMTPDKVRERMAEIEERDEKEHRDAVEESEDRETRMRDEGLNF